MTTRPTEPSDWSDDSAALLRSVGTAYTPSDADCERVRRALMQRLSEQPEAPAASANASNASEGLSVLAKWVPIGIAVACVVAGAVVFMGSKRDNVAGEQPLAASRSTAAPAVDELVAQAPRNSPEPDAQPVDVVASAPTKTSPLPKANQRRKLTAASARTAPTGAETSPPSAADWNTAPSAAQPQRDSIPTPLAAAADREPMPAAATTPPAEQPTHDARAELAWLDITRTALQQSKLSKVLTLCAEHARLWPQGMFVQEREALAAIAACRSAAHDAEARAARFLRNYPHAPLRPRVQEACGEGGGAKTSR